jgi:hypothetical protein
MNVKNLVTTEECPKLNDEKPKNKLPKKKVLMATWDDSDGNEEEGNLALMAKTEAPGTESDSDSEEVFYKFTRLELKLSLSEMLENNHKLHLKLKNIKQIFITKNEENDKISKDNTNLKDKKYLHVTQDNLL